jgi:hypothetical protein
MGRFREPFWELAGYQGAELDLKMLQISGVFSRRESR